MMDDFYKTPMGKKYYERDLPALIESNNRMAKAQEEANALTATRIKQETRKMQLEQRMLLVEMHRAGITLKDLMVEQQKED